jgi:hypothetical protein
VLGVCLFDVRKCRACFELAQKFRTRPPVIVIIRELDRYEPTILHHAVDTLRQVGVSDEELISAASPNQLIEVASILANNALIDECSATQEK